VGQPLCLAPLREVLARRLQRTQIGPQAKAKFFKKKKKKNRPTYFRTMWTKVSK